MSHRQAPDHAPKIAETLYSRQIATATSTTATVDPAPSIGPWTTGAVSGYPLTMGVRIQCMNIDCHDPSRLARFWEDALGWRRTYEEGDEVVLEPPEGSPEDGVVPDLVFFRVPEDKTLKNRLHFDLRPDDQGAEVQRLIRLGARLRTRGRVTQLSRHGHGRAARLRCPSLARRPAMRWRRPGI